mmetsp:Transcript_139154/g.242157  ORF Transcript_139154/g.242157 Transcript_139154/m.242157 type:complete len:450 (+) Transcript_139154:144-1493(+)
MSFKRWVLLLLLTGLAGGAHLRHIRLKRNVALKQQVDYTLQLNNYQNVQYSGAFTLGQQTLPVVYDTGSFEVLVLSEKCYSCNSVLKKYDSQESASFQSAGGVQASHMFGSGPVRSEKGYEHVYFGDSMSPYNVAHAPFWQILDHEIAAWDENANFAGIVGLSHTPQVPIGFAPEPGTNELTLLSALQIDLFSVCLQRSVEGAPGWLSVGPSVHSRLYAGGFSTIPVIGQVHWGVQMTEFHVPGVSTSNPCSPSCGVILDTGTSLIAVPPSLRGVVNALQERLNPDCSNIDSMPVLRFVLGGIPLELPPRAYVMKVHQLGMQIPISPEGVWDMMRNGPNWQGVDTCQVAFMVIDKHSPQWGPVWILGMPFLRYYYTIFERTAKKIHVALATPSCSVQQGAPIGFSSTSAFNQTGSMQYTSLDYKPDRVDLASARLPAWASAPGNATIVL